MLIMDSLSLACYALSIKPVSAADNDCPLFHFSLWEKMKAFRPRGVDNYQLAHLPKQCAVGQIR
jgi:hypothetical protein